MKPSKEYHINNIIRAYDSFLNDPHTLNSLLESIEALRRFRDNERTRDNSQLTLNL